MKEKLNYYVICAVILSMVVSCRENAKVNEVFDRVDSIIIDHPDSALQILDGIRGDVAECPKSQRMRYELLHADAQNKAYVDFTTDSVMKEVVAYYEEHGTPNEQMKANYLLGCVYRDLHEVPLTLQYYQDAVEKADTTSADCDLYTLYAIYGQMADLYSSQFLPDDELKSLQLAENIAINDGRMYDAVVARQLQARVFYNLNQWNRVISIVDSARADFLKMNMKESAAHCLAYKITVLVNCKEYEKAKAAMKVFEAESGLFDIEGNIEESRILYLDDKGKIAVHDGNYQLAKNCFYTLASKNEKEAAYRGLLELYTVLHNPDSMAKYSFLYAENNDSSFLKLNVHTVERMTAMYDYTRILKKEEITALKLSESQNKVKELIIVLLFLFITFSVLLYIIREKRKKTADYVNTLIYDLTLAKERMQELEEESKRMYTEKDIKSKDLEIKILNECIKQNELTLAHMEQGIVQKSFFETPIFKVLQKKSKMGKDWSPVTFGEWSDLLNEFSIYYKYYIEIIEGRASLTYDQRRVSILLRLHFSEEEIIRLMDIDSQRLNRIKMQINKKLFGMTDAKSLRNNLNGIK